MFEPVEKEISKNPNFLKALNSVNLDFLNQKELPAFASTSIIKWKEDDEPFKFLLIMMISAALMSHYPINEEDQIIREEMKRQALVGEDLIKKAAVMHLLFKNGLNTNPHEFNELQKNIISN